MNIALILPLLLLSFDSVEAKESARKPSSEGARICGAVLKVGVDRLPYVNLLNGANGKTVTVQIKTGDRDRTQAIMASATAALGAHQRIYFCVETDKSDLDASEIALSSHHFFISSERGLK